MAETQDDHRLIVSLEARIRNYEKALEKAQSETSRRMLGIEKALKRPRAEMTRFEKAGANMASSFSKSVAKASSALSTFGAGLAAGAGFAAITSLGGALEKLKATISEYDQIASDSKTAGLKTDTFQALAFAAKQANIEYDGFNSSLDIFAKNSGLAAKGQGALYSGLKNLNPQLLQSILNTKDQEERLKLVADAMSKTSDATEKAALSTVIFGKGGVEMARILEQGRASIDRFKQTAQDLGIIIPDDLLQRAGELDDKLDVLSKVINVQLGESLIKLAPLLVGATTGMADFSKELNEFSGLVNNFTSNPSLENLLKLINGGAPGGGLLDSVVNKARALGDGLKLSANDAGALLANIDFLKNKLVELQAQAAAGADVKLEIADAEQNLSDLLAKLAEVADFSGAAAKAISANFAQAFREAENASMAALAKMTGEATQILPTVHRYGGDPNKIALPQEDNYQSNVNGSGVGVRGYKSTGPWENPVGATANEWAKLTPQDKQDIYEGKTTYDKILYGTDKTADNTGDTADNVSELNRTSSRGFSDLSSRQTVAISKLSEVASWMKLNSYALAALVHNNDSGATGVGKTMFGDAFDPQFGSYISSWGVGTVKRPTLQLGPRDTGQPKQGVGNITVGDININGVSDGAQAGRQAAYEFVRTVYGAMSGSV
ncbi:hypothetical protein A9174_19345 [Mesorhizobium loti NZP2037]|nr:hypothetical protein [Mesorhizobium loti]ANN58687.1 hypothetical protein A9174_19345 [Mesorhizobium loti NZP2037]